MHEFVPSYRVQSLCYEKERNYFLGWRHLMQGQNNIDADASANCDQGILRKIFKRKIILQKNNAKKDNIWKENPEKEKK